MASITSNLADEALDALVAKLPSGSTMTAYKGSAPANAAASITTQTALATITLPGSPWSAASGGSVSSSGDWTDSSADAGSSDAPTFCRITSAGGTYVIQLTAGVGSGEVSFNGSITAGQPVTCTVTLGVTQAV